MTVVTYHLMLQLAALRRDLTDRLNDETRDRQMIAEDAAAGIDRVICAIADRRSREGGAQRDVTAVTEQTAMLPVSRRDLAQILTALDQRGDRTNDDPRWRDLVERVEHAAEEWGPPTLREARHAEA